MKHVISGYRVPILLLCFVASSIFSAGAGFADTVPIGREYQGPKCVITVADFALQVPGAPQEIGDGLREMLQTALFESNYFIVVDRLDSGGISAEQLLSDSFMADADAILQQGMMDPAEVLIYGTLISLEGGGAGLRVKMPWMPLNAGGKYYKAKASVELRAVDSASGRVVAAATVDSSAKSTQGELGGTFGGIDLPAELELFRNTPLELCIRDCIYRGVLDIVQKIPKELYRHSD